MKKIIVLAILLIGSSCNQKSSKTEIDHKQEQKVVKSFSWKNSNSSLIEGLEGYFPLFYSDNQIIYTNKSRNGLWLYDTNQKSDQLITELPKSGSSPSVNNGKLIFQVKDPKKRIVIRDLRNLESNENEEVKTHLSPENYLRSINAIGQSAFPSSDLTSIMYKSGDQIKGFSPQGKKNYTNVSLSPSKDKILYRVSGDQAYIINMQGEVVKKLGDIYNPSWVDDKTIVYERKSDDGSQTIKSDVYVASIENDNEVNLSTDIDELMENPRVSPSRNSILANTPTGKIYQFKQK